MNYLRPKSILEAAEAGAQPGVSYLAGGTDLILKMRQGEVKPLGLVDLQDVSGLRQIQVKGEWLDIGSMVSFAALQENDRVDKEAPALWLACQSMGAPQIRHQATIGGNLANCSPAADGLPALLALNAQVRLVTRAGETVLPLAELLQHTPLWQPGTLLAGLRLPLNGRRSGFAKLGRRQALAIARLSVAVSLAEENGRAKEVMVAFGAAGKRPFLSSDLAEKLSGRVLDESFNDLACREAKEVIRQVLGERASAPYKREAVSGVMRAALESIRKGEQTSGDHTDS